MASCWPFASPLCAAVVLDPFLQYCRRRDALLEYDISLSPRLHAYYSRTSAPNNPYTHRLSLYDLIRPATTPPLSHLYIECDLFPTAIHIYAANYRCVTVEEVLTQIHKALQRNFSTIEWKSLDVSTREALQYAFWRRVWRTKSHDEYLAEVRSGPRMIDWVGHKWSFAGLVAKEFRKHGISYWRFELKLRPLEKKVKFLT